MHTCMCPVSGFIIRDMITQALANIHTYCTHQTAVNADCVRTARLYCLLCTELDRVSQKKGRFYVKHFTSPQRSQ